MTEKASVERRQRDSESKFDLMYHPVLSTCMCASTCTPVYATPL